MIPPLFHGKMLWVNLEDQTLEEREVEPDLYARRVGGAPLISSFLKDGCIGLSCGPLTGSPCPAGSAAVAAVRKDGRNHFAPVMLNAGLELKLSGFDFMVVEGNSEKPVYLWIRDEVADLVECRNPTPDAWDTITLIRKEQGDSRIKVISSGAEISASLDYVSGWDGIYFGGSLRSKGLRAIAVKGMSEMPVKSPGAYLAKCSGMMAAAKGRVGGRAGVESLLPKGAASGIPGIGRHRSCYSCPYPCMSYASLDNNGTRKMLLMDQRSLVSLRQTAETSDDLLGSLERFHRTGACIGYSGSTVIDTITSGIEVNDAIAAGFVLGLCPRYLGTIGGDIEEYCRLVSVATGEDLPADKVVSLGRSMLKEGDPCTI